MKNKDIYSLSKNQKILLDNISWKEASLKNIIMLSKKLFPKKSEEQIMNMLNTMAYKNFFIIKKYYVYKKGNGEKTKWNNRGLDVNYRDRFNKNESHNKNELSELHSIFNGTAK